MIIYFNGLSALVQPVSIVQFFTGAFFPPPLPPPPAGNFYIDTVEIHFDDKPNYGY